MSTTTQLSCTPLHDWHTAHGAKMVDFAGWSMPVRYSTIVEEHQATRSAAGLFDISHMGRLRITGAEAVDFLDQLLTRRVTDMKPGQIRYSLVCNEEGGILDDVLVYSLPEQTDEFLLVVNASNREKIVAWFHQHNSPSVEINDQTFSHAMIALQGPLAVETVDKLFQCGLSTLRYYTGKQIEVEGTDIFITRTGYTGEDGCEIICNAEHAVSLWTKLFEAIDTSEGKPAGLAARDTLRLEAGMPLYGHELSEDINPVQAGLGFALNLKERDFVGRDAIATIQADGNQPVRVGLQLEGRRVAREGSAVLLGDDQVGTVTSGTFSPTFDKPISMAYASDSCSSVGTSLVVDIRGQQQNAQVVPLPFYERDK